LKKLSSSKDPKTEEHEDEFVLDDYESDKDIASRVTSLSELGLSNETQTLLKKLGIDVGGGNNDENAPIQEGPKIFYCSRTHSQLSQFSNELRRISLPPVIDPEEVNSVSKQDLRNISEELKHLTLGSRKNLCINPKVNKLSSTTAINEKCLDLQKPGTSLDHKCPYLPNKESESLVTQFRDHAISKIRDIEELGQLGKQLGVCPYYASRAAIPESEV
jgi:chromosome transmission fidelity protein 1